jgi:hypothetical protein
MYINTGTRVSVERQVERKLVAEIRASSAGLGLAGSALGGSFGSSAGSSVGSSVSSSAGSSAGSTRAHPPSEDDDAAAMRAELAAINSLKCVPAYSLAQVCACGSSSS